MTFLVGSGRFKEDSSFKADEAQQAKASDKKVNHKLYIFIYYLSYCIPTTRATKEKDHSYSQSSQTLSKTHKLQFVKTRKMAKEVKKDATLSKLSEEEQLRRENNSSEKPKSMTIISRLMLFFLFPTFVGSAGLLSSHLQNMYGKNPVEMNFDRDFVYPFLVTVVLVVIVSIQTGNFSSYKASPLVSWPKVVKKRKIVRKTVVLDDDGNVIEDEDMIKKLLAEKSEQAKKDD